MEKKPTLSGYFHHGKRLSCIRKNRIELQLIANHPVFQFETRFFSLFSAFLHRKVRTLVFNDFLIPVERILRNAFQRTIAAIIAINVHETVALLHFASSV